ncbi:hypothetical protein Hanom_Chr09g00844331 [Helianthus anomalus]
MFSAAVDLGVIVEFRVDVFLPACPPWLIWGCVCCHLRKKSKGLVWKMVKVEGFECKV